MYISAINNVNPNFGMVSKVRIPMADGTTKVLKVVGDTIENCDDVKITRIYGDIMSKGQSIAKVKDYRNKQGFDNNEFCNICEELSQGAEEDSLSVIDKILDSIAHPSIDYNA